MNEVDSIIRKIDVLNRDIAMVEGDNVIRDVVSYDSHKLIKAAAINVLHSRKHSLIERLKDIITVGEKV